jgi:hypothetical protein
MSGWNWFAIAWRLSGENATLLEAVFKQNFIFNLTILAYLTDKASAEALEIERMKRLR